jgi:ribosomal protein S18 acetylase RimI-like enzyme
MKKAPTTTTMTRKAKTKKTTLSWRVARADDHDAIVAMSLALFTEDPSVHVVTARSVRRTLKTLAAEPARGLVVVADGAAGVSVDGGVVAYALLVSFWSNELGGEVCTIDELYVRPGARNAGLGSMLIQALSAGRIKRFTKAVALELEVTSKNLRARALYERLGFRLRKNACLRLVRA